MTDIAYMKLGRLLLDRPGRLVYHRLDPRRATWPRYIEGRRLGFEEQRTRCGRVIYRSHADERLGLEVRVYDGLRLDNAMRVGRACVLCEREAAA